MTEKIDFDILMAYCLCKANDTSPTIQLGGQPAWFYQEARAKALIDALKEEGFEIRAISSSTQSQETQNNG